MKGKELLKDEEVQKFVQRYIILYGVQLGVYTVIAICMQVWWQYFVFMISFVALRSFAGGYHAKRESVCVVQSGAIVLAACLTMKFISDFDADSYMYCIIVGDYDFFSCTH